MSKHLILVAIPLLWLASTAWAVLPPDPDNPEPDPPERSGWEDFTPLLGHSLAGDLTTDLGDAWGYNVRYAGFMAAEPIYGGVFWYESEHIDREDDSRMIRTAWSLDSGLGIAMTFAQLWGLHYQPWPFKPGARLGATRIDVDGQVTYGFRLTLLAEGAIAWADNHPVGPTRRSGTFGEPLFGLFYYTEFSYTFDDDHPVSELSVQLRLYYLLGQTMSLGMRYVSTTDFDEFTVTLSLRLNPFLILLSLL